MLSKHPASRNRFPAELDDPAWLAARCQPLGEETVAAELGVSRKTIRRAYARFSIPQPKRASNGNGSAKTPTTSTNGSGKQPTTGSNGSSKRTTSGTNGSRKLANGKPNASRPLASDQELAKRVGNVKRGLEVVVATLVRLANEMQWVGDQVQPQTTRPAPVSTQRRSG